MTANTENTLHHFYAGDVQDVKVTNTPRAGQTATGYGPKIPTPYMVRTFGPGPKWLRVYVVNYGNAGSTFVRWGGVDRYLSPGAELILETVRDGGTVLDAREKIGAWPAWMANSEGFITPNTRYVLTTSGYGTPASRAADSAQIVLDWSGVLAHLERDGVATPPSPAQVLKGGFTYIHKDGRLSGRVTVQGMGA